MNLGAQLAAPVRAGAAERCQYCLMHQRLQGATFHIEHVIPRSQGGSSELSNLALACPGCNLRKADRTTAIDPVSGERAQLFNPAQQAWSRHFRFSGYRIEGLTPTGRATIAALDLNQPRRLRIRQAEEAFGLYPPA